MKLTFLGTAAAEGFPGIFCSCDTCNEARQLGGKNLRYRSALLVNADCLIDFGPDLLAAAQRFGLRLAGVTTGLVTHAHPDHFYLANFEMREKPFTAGLEIPRLTLFGPADITRALSAAFADLSKARLAVETVGPFQTWDCNGYRFSSFSAYHALGSLECLFYAIQRPEGSFLYATDTGPFPEETWAALAGRSFDVIILEETLGDGHYTQHLGFDSFFEHAARLRREAILKSGGRIIAHHFSHSGNPTYDRLAAIFQPRGVEVAYDGMVVEI